MSRHRTTPPTFGIYRRTRLRVVDNSQLGKDAVISGRPAYCIQTYARGHRRTHMAKAQLGDKILVAIRGEMKKAYVVGTTIHRDNMKHGVPSTDSNNIVLVSDDGNPLGTRVLAPMPAVLRAKHHKPEIAKILSIATKFV